MMDDRFETALEGRFFCNHDFIPMDSWRVMRIMSEFVESFETMSRMPDQLVAVFGSARTPEDSPLFKEAMEAGGWWRPATASSPGEGPASWGQPPGERSKRAASRSA